MTLTWHQRGQFEPKLQKMVRFFFFFNKWAIWTKTHYNA